MLTQKLAEMAGIAMPVADLANAGRLAAEMHAGVVEAVGEDKRLGAEHSPVKQSREDSGIGLEAGSHNQRRRLALELGDLGLDTGEKIEIAGDEARGAGASPVAFRPLRRPLDEGLIESEPQIVVAGEIDVVATLYADGACVNRLDIDQLAPQCLAREPFEKGLVPAFASRHHH